MYGGHGATFGALYLSCMAEDRGLTHSSQLNDDYGKHQRVSSVPLLLTREDVEILSSHGGIFSWNRRVLVGGL